MADRFVPAPTSNVRFDLAGWIYANARPGDTVHLRPDTIYWTETIQLASLVNVILQGHRATLLTKEPPPSRIPDPRRDWHRPLELIGCSGVEIRNLTIRGPAPTRTTFTTKNFDVAYEGQHAISVLGCDSTTICDVTFTNTYGDGVYISGNSRNTIVGHSDFLQIGRACTSTTSANGVLFYGCDFISCWRTVFNLEVHPGDVVQNYEVNTCQIRWHGLNMITSTGKGDSRNVSFRNLTLKPSKPFNAEIYGPGSEPLTGHNVGYGKRENFVFENISGGEPHLDRSYYIRIYNVDGLSLNNVPYPMKTEGSTLPSGVQYPDEIGPALPV